MSPETQENQNYTEIVRMWLIAVEHTTYPLTRFMSCAKILFKLFDRDWCWCCFHGESCVAVTDRNHYFAKLIVLPLLPSRFVTYPCVELFCRSLMEFAILKLTYFLPLPLSDGLSEISFQLGIESFWIRNCRQLRKKTICIIRRFAPSQQFHFYSDGYT